MSPTLLELAVAILLIVVAWQIGLAIAPDVLRLLRTLRRDVDEAADEALSQIETQSQRSEEDTRHEIHR
jgi:hypothetical protein